MKGLRRRFHPSPSYGKQTVLLPQVAIGAQVLVHQKEKPTHLSGTHVMATKRQT